MGIPQANGDVVERVFSTVGPYVEQHVRRELQAAAADGVGRSANPLAPRPPHLPAKARSVIFLFMYGGPSQVDTFDYKPRLYELDGQTIPVKTFGRGGKKNEGRVVGPKWNFRRYGECGKWVSDLFPHLATCVD